MKKITQLNGNNSCSDTTNLKMFNFYSVLMLTNCMIYAEMKTTFIINGI